MHTHRFRAAMDVPDLPNDAPVPLPPGAFLVYPLMPYAGLAGAVPWPPALYQIALQQAQAVHQPSLLQRQLAPNPN